MIAKSIISKQNWYKSPRMTGDKWAVERVDMYFDERKKVLAYKGKSAVDRRAFNFYEKLLIAPGATGAPETPGKGADWGGDARFWWNRDFTFIRKVMWFLRRLKVGITKAQEAKLLRQWKTQYISWSHETLLVGLTDLRGKGKTFNDIVKTRLGKHWTPEVWAAETKAKFFGDIERLLTRENPSLPAWAQYA